MTSGTARRPLAAAITTVLAVTTGVALAAAPAATASPTVTAMANGTVSTAPADQQAAPTVPARTQVVGAGSSGFLGSIEHFDSENNSSSEYRWFRPDGTSTLITEAFSDGPTLPNALVSDIVATADTHDNRVVRLRDMSTPATAAAAPVVIDLRTLGSTYYAKALYGSTVLAVKTSASGPTELHLVSKSGTGLSDRTITGVPADIEWVAWAKGTPDTALLSYKSKGVDSSRSSLAVIDLASAAVTDTYAPPAESRIEYRPADVSPTMLVRWEGDKLLVTDRATGVTAPVTVGFAGSKVLSLFGDWVAYGQSTDVGGGTAGDPLLPLTLRSLTGDRTVRVLDRVSGLVPASDGTLLARGGTVAQGEGVYRITVGADGTPTAELVASTGESTALTLDSTSVGPVVDLDPENNRVRLGWDLSHDNFSYTVELIHKASGQRYTHSLSRQGAGNFTFLWRGNFASNETDPGKAAFNGDYRWELTAKPDNGIGPDLHATGDFKVVRKPKIHDFGNNGSPDLLVRSGSGNLLRLDTMYDAWNRKVVPAGELQYVSGGWQSYQQIESVGDVAGTSTPDVIGRDSAGVLWLHQGTGSEAKPLADRVKIGPGWQVYHQLAGGSDLTNDGRADLVATDKAGDLYLYKGTGNATTPFAPRKKIGFGWGIYNQLTAVGNLAGGPAGDLVARDKSGVLWLYLGNGDGTYASRVKIGPGWNEYSHLVGIGDATMDGRPDLYVYGPNNTSYVYAGTGSWRTPFATRVPTDALVVNSSGYGINHVS